MAKEIELEQLILTGSVLLSRIFSFHQLRYLKSTMNLLYYHAHPPLYPFNCLWSKINLFFSRISPLHPIKCPCPAINLFTLLNVYGSQSTYFYHASPLLNLIDAYGVRSTYFCHARLLSALLNAYGP